ncbi:ANFV protein, partial [Dromas ardeola]|nr:ANFV protein [Dromas ardeola]
MQFPGLCCGASLLLLLVLPWAGAQPAGGEHGAELRSLQDLLEALGQLREEEGEPGLEDEPVAGAEDGGSEWDLPGAESGPPAAPLPAPSPPQPAEGQNQRRSLLSSYRRRHFSGCFGTRMERIGAQTGLGCNQYKARRSRVRAR